MYTGYNIPEYTVTVITDPPVIAIKNKFEYPVGSNITLTCMVTPTPPSDSEFSWNCSTGCFVHMETEQSLITKLEVTDSGEINCSVIIDDVKYTSELIQLRVIDNSGMFRLLHKFYDECYI